MEFPNLIELGLKVGDEVDGIFGEGVVTKIDTKHEYPIVVSIDDVELSFTNDGKYWSKYKLPSIWLKSDLSWFKPPTTLPEPDHAKEFYTGRKVWVRSFDGPWEPRIAATYISNEKYKLWAFADGDSEETADAVVPWDEVSYTKPEGAEDHEQ